MGARAIREEWDVLVKFLPKGWQEKAYETQALVRKRNIKDSETLLRVLLIHLADGKSLRTTAAYARESELCHINDTSLLRRLRASGDWLRWMAHQMRESLGVVEIPDSYLDKGRIKVIDASVISEPGSTGSNWRLHYSLDLSSLRCDRFEITDFQTGESFLHFPVKPNEVLLGDRAYCKRPGIFHVLSQGGDVLVRYHSTALPLLTYRKRPFSVLEKLRGLETGQVGDWNVYLEDETGHLVKGRLCAIRKSQEASEKSKRAIRKEASKKQRTTKPETYEFAEYVILFTTVSRHRLKGSDVLTLYRSRWQVELAFKRLKSIMDLGHLPKIDPECCKAWLYGKLLVALLVECIYQEAESFSPWGYPLASLQASRRAKQWPRPEPLAGV